MSTNQTRRHSRALATALGLAVALASTVQVASARDEATERHHVYARWFAARTDVPAGTAFRVRLSDTVSSGIAAPGDEVEGVVAHDVRMNHRVVIPEGSTVRGVVEDVRPAKHFGGQAYVTIRFTQVELESGDRIPIDGRLSAATRRQAGKDTATIAGSAVGGAILGHAIAGRDHDAVVGAVVGGGIGTAVASRRGPEAVIGRGAVASVVTTADAQVTTS